MARKRKSTPPELDMFFTRGLIDESDYREFWPRWWKANKAERERIKAELEPKAKPMPALPTKGVIHVAKSASKVTQAKRAAEREAKKIGGYVVRRDKSGKFNSRGRTFQAVKSKRK